MKIHSPTPPPHTHKKVFWTHKFKFRVLREKKKSLFFPVTQAKSYYIFVLKCHISQYSNCMQLLYNCSTRFYKRLDFYISNLYYKTGKWKIFLDVIMWQVSPGDNSYLFGLKRPPKGSSKLRKFHSPALLWKTTWDAMLESNINIIREKPPPSSVFPVCKALFFLQPPQAHKTVFSLQLHLEGQAVKHRIYLLHLSLKTDFKWSLILYNSVFMSACSERLKRSNTFSFLSWLNWVSLISVSWRQAGTKWLKYKGAPFLKGVNAKITHLRSSPSLECHLMLTTMPELIAAVSCFISSTSPAQFN